MQTRDQRLAVVIFQQVKEVKNKGKDFYNSYGSMAHKLPILIRTAGLAQALTYVDSRDSVAQKQLLRDLAATLHKPDLITTTITAELRDYMYLTQQTLAALLWYKRFAQSILDVKSGDTETSDTAVQIGR